MRFLRSVFVAKGEVWLDEKDEDCRLGELVGELLLVDDEGERCLLPFAEGRVILIRKQ